MNDESQPTSTRTKPTGFLNRWSARKHGDSQHKNSPEDLQSAENHIESDIPATFSGESEESEAALASNPTDAVPEDSANAVVTVPVLTDEDMPPIQSLSSDSDLSDFFNKGVSAALRKAALRHVFQQPKYNVRDGLNDYDGDYTVFEPLGDTITSDMKWHTARKERARLEAEEQEREALARQEAQEQELQEQASEEQVSEEQATDEQFSEEHVSDEEVFDSNVLSDSSGGDIAEGDDIADAGLLNFAENENEQNVLELALDDDSSIRRHRTAGKLTRVRSERPALLHNEVDDTDVADTEVDETAVDKTPGTDSVKSDVNNVDSDKQ